MKAKFTNKMHLKENLSKKTIYKMSQAAKNRPNFICEYCGKSINEVTINVGMEINVK